jgi:outer membrane lipoprotein-sorting protein
MNRVAAGVMTCVGLALSAMAAVGEEKATTPPRPGWNAEIAPSNSSDSIALDAHQKDLIDKVSSYFKTITTMQGNFIQTGADDRRMNGKFYLSRPGRFRFDYARPSRQIVISDGRYLAVQDFDLHNEDRVALDQTPFRLLLRTDVNLARDAKITEAQESDDLIVVVLQDKDPDTPGQIKLFLAKTPDLELKEWVARDAQGVDTRVEISDLAKGIQLDDELFKITALGPKE